MWPVMQQQQSRSSNEWGPLLDSLLKSYLTCEQTSESEELLRELVAAARPGIEGIVRRRLAFGASSEIQDREDISGEVVVELLRRLRVLKEEESGAAIERFSAYVATAARHACDEYLRRKYPQRRRLKTRLRYVLSTEPSFAVWQSGGENAAGQKGEWLCGLKIWQAQGAARGELPAERWRDVCGSSAGDRSRQGVTAMLTAIFEAVKAPVLFDELVGVVATLWGVVDRLVPVDGEKLQGDSAPDPESQLIHRLGLESLWSEICNLPAAQRAALLLNLRSGQGDSPLAVLPAMGIATLRQIAETLGMAAEEFAELWNQLPVDDQIIAQRLGITRQQVINLRKSARERLRRKLGVHNDVRE